ncbi:MAG: aminopeptidase N [bacterium]|nr:aminopeptidase N [bacterium]
MSDNKPQAKYLKDYRPSDYIIDTVELQFDLGEDFTTVKSTLAIHRNGDQTSADAPLVLEGVDLELLGISQDGQPLAADRFIVTDENLTLTDLPASFTLVIDTKIDPGRNTSLEGLYRSGGNFCTQCEAEGFRKITYFLDRPDVMVRYTTIITADRDRYPVLLSNGNLVDEGVNDNGTHWARWEDPFPKPSYLFALVAGKLVCLEDSFRTMNDRDVTLRIWVREPDLDRTPHAMTSLIKSMKWDEEVYGLEYDLDIFNIVAVDDFNMGAMENKSLNIFNSKYVLAKPETATDTDYVNVEGVIAHEYFHNWTGNRVTLSSWFHLSLKEGLTVFRDQCFTADMNSTAVERINSVTTLRASQFPEDAGPMAHPIRPDSYIEMNNFYTTTVYEKGAEVIRMIYTLLGPDAYRRGMDLYFERHDNCAVTTDDFVDAMADASGVDLEQFRLWYSQAGTPRLSVTRSFDEAEQVFSMTVKQSIPDTPGQKDKQPMHIPMAMGLLAADGTEIPLQLAGESVALGGSRVLDITQAEETFRFVNVTEKPVPSLLRGFSAPVYLHTDLEHAELSFLMANDTDSFNRWEAGQALATDLLLNLIADHQAGRELKADPVLITAFRSVLENRDLDPELAALAMVLPNEKTLAEHVEQIDPVAIHEVRDFLRLTIGRELRDLFLETYHANHIEGEYDIAPLSMGRRSLKNLCLSYLLTQNDEASRALALKQYREANNMTDSAAALSILCNTDCPERSVVLDDFYTRWQSDPLVLDKWFTLQATSSLPDTLDTVKTLLEHEAFDIKNPNRVRALISSFAHINQYRFNAPDGSAYEFVADQVLRLNKINPQVAAKMVGAFNRWLKFDADRRQLLKTQLERIVAEPELSPNVYEIASKALAME